jgi:hypothetical protein
MRQRSKMVILGGALALAAGCAHGQIGNPEGWSLMQSKHFNVYLGAPRHATAALAGLEYAYAGLSSSFFRGTELPKTDVLFLEEDEFSSVVGFLRHWVALAKLPSTATTIGADGLLIMRDTGNDHAGAQALAHLFIEKKFPHAALWFHEGFASYVRTVEYHGSGGNVSAACFGVPSGKQDTLLPLEKVANMSWEDYDGDEARSWYSFTNRTLIDYILHGDEGKNREKIGPFVNAMAAGDPLPTCLKTIFPGVSLAALDKKLGEHAADVNYHLQNATKWRGLCPLPFQILPDHQADQGERKISPASAADIKAVLDAIKKLPKLDGYPPWYPPDVIAKVGA